jgi:hypothetical protein
LGDPCSGAMIPAGPSADPAADPTADPTAWEAVGCDPSTTDAVIDCCEFVSDFRGIAGFGSRETGALDAGGAVKPTVAPELSTIEGGGAIEVRSELVDIGSEVVGVGSGVVDVVSGIVDVGSGVVDVGSGMVGVALVEGAGGTTGICKGTSTVA